MTKVSWQRLVSVPFMSRWRVKKLKITYFQCPIDLEKSIERDNVTQKTILTKNQRVKLPFPNQSFSKQKQKLKKTLHPPTHTHTQKICPLSCLGIYWQHILTILAFLSCIHIPYLFHLWFFPHSLFSVHSLHLSYLHNLTLTFHNVFCLCWLWCILWDENSILLS